METILIEIDTGKIKREKTETLYDFYKNLQRIIEEFTGIKVISINRLLVVKK